MKILKSPFILWGIALAILLLLYTSYNSYGTEIVKPAQNANPPQTPSQSFWSYFWGFLWHGIR